MVQKKPGGAGKFTRLLSSLGLQRSMQADLADSSEHTDFRKSTPMALYYICKYQDSDHKCSSVSCWSVSLTPPTMLMLPHTLLFLLGVPLSLLLVTGSWYSAFPFLLS